MMYPSPSELETQIANIKGTSILDKTSGQKTVYKTQHGQFGDVVVKVFLDSSDIERIEREIEVATKYNLPNVPRIFEVGQVIYDGEQLVYIVEEFVDGQTLYNYLSRNKILDVRHALQLIEFLLVMAVELETRQLVHRDIKPKNIMIKPDGSFALLDFGIARHLDKESITQTKALMGPHTPGYAAPEQFRNIKKDVDIRADLFSIGVVGYEVLTGKQPFAVPNLDPFAIAMRTMTFNPKPVVIPGDSQRQLAGFLSTLMQRYASRRPASAILALNWFRALRPTVIA